MRKTATATFPLLRSSSNPWSCQTNIQRSAVANTQRCTHSLTQRYIHGNSIHRHSSIVLSHASLIAQPRWPSDLHHSKSLYTASTPGASSSATQAHPAQDEATVGWTDLTPASGKQESTKMEDVTHTSTDYTSASTHTDASSALSSSDLLSTQPPSHAYSLVEAWQQAANTVFSPLNDHSLPVRLMQCLFETVHLYSGLSVGAAVVVTALSLRVVFFPAFVWTQRRWYVLETQIKPTPEETQKMMYEMMDKSSRMRPEKALAVHEKIGRYLRGIVPPLTYRAFTVAMYVSAFYALRSMTEFILFALVSFLSSRVEMGVLYSSIGKRWFKMPEGSEPSNVFRERMEGYMGGKRVKDNNAGQTKSSGIPGKEDSGDDGTKERKSGSTDSASQTSSPQKDGHQDKQPKQFVRTNQSRREFVLIAMHTPRTDSTARSKFTD